MDRKKLLQCILAAALAVSACGDDGDDPAGGGDAGTGGTCDGLTYATFAEPLFKANCTSCHSMANAPTLGDDVVMDTLAGVKAQKEHIIEHAVKLVEPKMPLGTQGLPKDQRDKLEKWLNCGAPP